MCDESSLGESGARFGTDVDPANFEGKFNERFGQCMDDLRGVSGVEVMELSSLLEGRVSPEIDGEAETGFGASDSERDFCEGRSGVPRQLALSPVESVSVLGSLCSLLWDTCSLSLLAYGGAGRLCDRVEGGVDDVKLDIEVDLNARRDSRSRSMIRFDETS